MCSKALLDEPRVPLNLVKARLQTILLKRSSVEVYQSARMQHTTYNLRIAADPLRCAGYT